MSRCNPWPVVQNISSLQRWVPVGGSHVYIYTMLQASVYVVIHLNVQPQIFKQGRPGSRLKVTRLLQSGPLSSGTPCWRFEAAESATFWSEHSYYSRLWTKTITARTLRGSGMRMSEISSCWQLGGERMEVWPGPGSWCLGRWDLLQNLLPVYFLAPIADISNHWVDFVTWLLVMHFGSSDFWKNASSLPTYPLIPTS